VAEQGRLTFVTYVARKVENTFVLLITQFITVFHVTKCAGLVPKKIIQCSCSRMLCKKKIAVTKNVEPSLIY